MKNLSVSPGEFLSVYRRQLERTRKLLARCARDPSYDNIHDARASIRKLEAALSLMPKSFRRDRRSVSFMSRLESFYDLTTSLADHEAALRVLVALDPGSQPRALPPRTIQEQADLQTKARTLATLARGLIPPHVRRDDLSRRKLTARLRKRSATLARKVVVNGRGAAEGRHDIRELHRLRRDTRRLRYVIRYFEPSKGRSTLCQQLRSIQDFLGSVRDCDGALLLLSRCGTSKSDPAFVRLASKREAMYASFKRARAGTLDSVRALASIA